KNTDLGIHYANYPAVNGRCPDGRPNAGYCVPPGGAAINNDAIAGNAINPVSYKGGRAELLYKIDADWNILLTQMYQTMDAEGVFYQQPQASDGAALKPLQVTLFNDARDLDRFENTAWTVHGKIGDLRAVYTGGYLVRHVDQVGDYTNYARGVYGDYYQCYGPGSGGETGLASSCFSPRAIWHEKERDENVQHELRLSTPGGWRLRGIAGVFFEDNRLFDQTDWGFKSLPVCTASASPGAPGNSGCLSNVGTLPGTSVEKPGVQAGNVAFFQDTRRDVRQLAFFFSLDYDLIPKVLTIAVGTRHFRFDNSLRGDVSSGFGCFDQGNPPGGCLVGANNLDARHLQNSQSGDKSRVNVSWHVTPAAMLYFTWSQGFRPGGFNLTGGSQFIYGPAQSTAGGQRIAYKQFVLPNSYRPDSLTNEEMGWKSEWLDRRLRWDGALYEENWNDVQVGLFDPGLLGNLTVNTNGQNFRIRGLETSVRAKITRALSVQGTASWNHSVQTNSPALLDGNPSSSNFGKPITQACDSSGTHCTPVVNPFGPVGGPSANSPPLQFSLRMRYRWMRAGYAWFIQADATHTGHSFTQAGANPSLAVGGAVNTTVLRFENPAYSTYDASMGVAHEAWSAKLFAQNLGDSHASVYTNTGQFILAETVLRPRVIGVSFGYRF
ncbi:MAG: TonB-dependent receptor, partial [Steroidobacteraceae bacterium]|nr:TonB-dependent receptor [Steroidobacteraceae bacterium]